VGKREARKADSGDGGRVISAGSAAATTMVP
jgi:hypothetical protein